MDFKRSLQRLDTLFGINHLRKQLLNYALKGDNVECPCCNSKFITFLPAGLDIKRANAKCPNCGSLERHRNLWLFFSNHAEMFGGHSIILHAAPETIFYNYFSSRMDVEYHPIDLEPVLPATKKMDLTELQYNDDYFDAVICSHVLEHIPDDIKAMKEIYRVLKPGAWAILNVPVSQKMETTWEDQTIDTPEKRKQSFGQSDHVRIYGRDYVERLNYAGFKVEVIQYSARFDVRLAFRYGLREKELIYLCYK